MWLNDRERDRNQPTKPNSSNRHMMGLHQECKGTLDMITALPEQPLMSSSRLLNPERSTSSILKARMSSSAYVMQDRPVRREAAERSEQRTHRYVVL